MCMKVLVVEDDPVCIKIFKNIVESETKDIFDYLFIDNLTNALEIIKNNEIALILLDLMLTDSDAINTLQAMTSQVKTSPIVVLSTLDDENLIQQAFLYGVQDYLIKDKYDINMFTHVARQAIRRFVGKIEAETKRELEKIINNLKSIDKQLEKIQVRVS